jgi:hypothetical protein
MKPAIALWLLVAAGVAHAAPLIDEPVAELRLKSGKVLTQAIAKSYTPTSVFIRHASGAASVKYEELPDDLATALSARRPAPPTAEELAAQEARRQAALAREAAALKAAPPAAKRGPSMPLNQANLGFSLVRIRGAFADVEIHNFGESSYWLEPYSLTATTSLGRKILGAGWVGLDSTGRVSVTMAAAQAMMPGTPRTMTVRFELPSDATIVNVEWLHPQR